MTGADGSVTSRMAAFSRRKRRTYSAGDSPTMAEKMRWKWEGEKQAIAASPERNVPAEVPVDEIEGGADAPGVFLLRSGLAHFPRALLYTTSTAEAPANLVAP